MEVLVALFVAIVAMAVVASLIRGRTGRVRSSQDSPLEDHRPNADDSGSHEANSGGSD